MLIFRDARDVLSATEKVEGSARIEILWLSRLRDGNLP